jgi:large subunit ribosomal protein L17
MKTFAGRKLGRKSGHREMLLRNLTSSLLQNEKIQTTVPKAKELRRYAEKIITMAKQEGLHAQKQVAKYIHQDQIRKKLFEVLVPRYQSRKGGYTQIIRADQRLGDSAPLAVIRLLP